MPRHASTAVGHLYSVTRRDPAGFDGEGERREAVVGQQPHGPAPARQTHIAPVQFRGDRGIEMKPPHQRMLAAAVEPIVHESARPLLVDEAASRACETGDGRRV